MVGADGHVGRIALSGTLVPGRHKLMLDRDVSASLNMVLLGLLKLLRGERPAQYESLLCLLLLVVVAVVVEVEVVVVDEVAAVVVVNELPLVLLVGVMGWP